MITGVLVQGFGRVALARVYMKVQAAINEAHSAGGAGDAAGSRHQPEQASLKLNGISSSLGTAVRYCSSCVLSYGVSRNIIAVRHAI